MEYFNNILCITQPELLEVMSESNYKQMVRRGKISRARRGGNGRQALIVFDSLPGKYRSAVRERKPDISTMPLQEWLRANYTPDAEARSYFSAFRFDNGSALPAEKINEYTVNASVIKAVLRLMASANALRRGRNHYLFQTGVRPHAARKHAPFSQEGRPVQTGRICLPYFRSVPKSELP